MLTCHEMTEEEKYSICQWKYSGEYAIYDGMPYEEQKKRGFGFVSDGVFLFIPYLCLVFLWCFVAPQQQKIR